MLQRFLLIGAFFRVLYGTIDPGKRQPALYILSMATREGGGENERTEGSAGISERGFPTLLTSPWLEF